MSPAAEKLASVRKSCSAKKTLVAIRPGRVLKHGFYSIRTQYTRAGRADRLACMWAGLGWAGKLIGLASWQACMLAGLGWAGKLAGLASCWQVGWVGKLAGLHVAWPELGWQVGWAGKLARLAGLVGMDGWLGGRTFGFD